MKRESCYPEWWKYISFNDWIEDNNKIWGCSSSMNAICEIDKLSKKTKIVGVYPNNSKGESELSLSVVKIDNKIVFTPNNGNDILIYDTTSEEIAVVPLDFERLNIANNTYCEKFYSVCFESNEIYMFGIGVPFILRLDIDNKIVEYLRVNIELLPDDVNKNGKFFTEGFAKVNSEIWLPMRTGSSLFAFDRLSHKQRYIKLDSKGKAIRGLSQKGTKLYLTTFGCDSDELLCLDIEALNIARIKIPSKNQFHAPLIMGDKIILYSDYSSDIRIYDTQKEEWDDFNNLICKRSRILNMKENNGIIEFFMNEGNGLYLLNQNSRDLSCVTYYINDDVFLEEAYRENINYILKNNSGIINESVMSLHRFLDCVQD